MENTTRRDFLRNTLKLGAGMAALSALSPVMAIAEEEEKVPFAWKPNAAPCKLIEELDWSKVRGSVYFVFSVQEEVGLRGARTASHGIQADVAISIDTTAASDTFESMMDQMVCLGKGPGIKAMDFSFISSVAVRRKLQKVAKENNIPFVAE